MPSSRRVRPTSSLWRIHLLSGSVVRSARLAERSDESVYDRVVDADAKQYGKHVGITEPRLCTQPLRELTPETSHGFSVIEFAKDVLGVVLYPWQRALLIRALELNEDGTYRFRKIFVLVG